MINFPNHAKTIFAYVVSRIKCGKGEDGGNAKEKGRKRKHTIKLGGKYGQRICGEYTYMYSSVLLTSPTRGKNKLFLGGWGEGGAVVFMTI